MRAFLVVLFCLAALAFRAEPAASAPHCGDVNLRVRTFHVEARWTSKTYRIGDVAKLEVKVTRPAHEDPATDEGEPLPAPPPREEPAEGVTVGVGVMVGDVFLNGGAITDAQGEAVVKVHLHEGYVRPGKATSRLYASKKYLTDLPGIVTCVTLEEFGTLDPGPGFTAIR